MSKKELSNIRKTMSKDLHQTGHHAKLKRRCTIISLIPSTCGIHVSRLGPSQRNQNEMHMKSHDALTFMQHVAGHGFNAMNKIAQCQSFVPSHRGAFRSWSHMPLGHRRQCLQPHWLPAFTQPHWLPSKTWAHHAPKAVAHCNARWLWPMILKSKTMTETGIPS